MYHTSTENQIFNINKSFLTKGFPSKDLQTYIASFTRHERDVAHYILEFRQQDSQRISNSTIARHVKCSVKTVTRATNKFHRDGFITKKQIHPYDINSFSFHEKTKKGPDAFMYWLSDLPPRSQDLYISHGIIIDHKNKKISTGRNVPPYLSSSLLDNLFINSSPSCARTRERRQDFFKKIKGKTVEHLKKSSSYTKQSVFKEKTVKKSESFLTILAKKEDLLQKIEECKQKIADPHKYVKYDVIKSSVVFFEKDLDQYLRELKEYNDFASISH